MVSCIWDHFTKASAEKAVCKVCFIEFSCKRGSTSNLLRHLKSKHPTELASANADFDDFSEKIVRLLTADNAAFRLVDRPEFHALFPPTTRMPTRYHLSKVVMPSMVENLRETIRQRLTGKRVTLCVDQWTSKGGRLTLSCFNVHYVNEKGELKSIVLSVPPLHGRHTADNLRAQIEEVVEKYKLDVAAVITDSASNIRKAVKDMGKFNPRCAAHQLHLAVTNALFKWKEFPELIKIKKFARNLNKSSTVRAQYFKYCKDLGLKEVGIPQSVETRWGSLFFTIQMVLQQWPAVNATLKCNGKETLSDESRLMLTKLSNLLHPFDEYTKKMCSESCLLTEVAFIFPEIMHNISAFIESESGPCKALAKLLLAQMEQRTAYYTDSEEMKKLLFFDPRAIQVFPYDWKKIGSDLLSSSSSSSQSTSKASKYAWCRKMIKTDNCTPISDEIDKYLYECSRGVDMDTDPLRYWSSHSGSFYPSIKEMALKSLPIPATSVSAERVFSAAGLLDKQRLRNNISAETMESCLLLRLNNIGERAREISYQPPLILVPLCDSTDIVCPTVDITYGYMTDESEFEESGSDDEEEEF